MKQREIKMEQVLHNGQYIDRVELDLIKEQMKFTEFNFIRDFAPSKQEEMSWIEVDELVKLYKEPSLKGDKRLELEEEIFRANFNQMYYFASKNTYVIKGFNDDDIIPCIFMAHRSLLSMFKFKSYVKNGVNIDSQFSFRSYLKIYFKTKFHRYFVEGAKGFGSNTSLSNFKKRYIDTVFVENVEDYNIKNNIFDSHCQEYFDKVELSDRDIKEDLITAIRKSLPNYLAKSLLIEYKLTKKGANRDSKELISHQANIAIRMLKDNEEIKELFKYYIDYCVDK